MTTLTPRTLVALTTLVFLTALTFDPIGAAPPQSTPSRYAIKGARIVSMAGPVIDTGTVTFRDGLIEDVGPAVMPAADAVVIDGAGLTVYPGFIDMANGAAVDVSESVPAVAGVRAGGPSPTTEDQERAKRALFLRPDFDAARHVRFDGPVMRRLASAGITSVLATPPAGLVRGASALINVLAPPDDPQVGAVADRRRELVVVKAEVAQHISFSSGGARGAGYPAALLGTIAFVRQSLYDAQWQREAKMYDERHAERPRQVVDPVLEALVPVLERRVPVAIEADSRVEVARALDLAKEFTLDPIVVGVLGDDAAQDLKAAGARAIYSLNFPAAPETGRGGRGRAGGEPVEETLREIRLRQNAPKGPAAFGRAAVPFAFTSGGLQDPAVFVRNAARTVKEGGLSPEAALEALTTGAARIAGVASRLGSIQKGRIANVVVTDGDWFDEKSRIRHVFIDGRPVEIDAPATPAAAGRGRE